MRVVSLVPSITETLIDCGVEVVGRTRFCIHPAAAVAAIPRVGGTKEVNWEKVAQTEPDLVILDREENTREMADECPFPYHVLHITGIENISRQLMRLAAVVQSDALHSAARRWSAVAAARPADVDNANQVPGVLDWLVHPGRWERLRRIEYLIWRDPWMAIGPDTFIYSMLQKVGLGRYLSSHKEKYPHIALETLDPEETLLLFSSEPFPFQRYREDIVVLGYAAAIVDGECFSWYGRRSLDFVESLI